MFEAVSDNMKPTEVHLKLIHPGKQVGELKLRKTRIPDTYIGVAN